jgi:hypothetical protein
MKSTLPTDSVTTARMALPGVHAPAIVSAISSATASREQRLEAVRREIAAIPKFGADADETQCNAVRRANLCREARELRGDGSWIPGAKE